MIFDLRIFAEKRNDKMLQSKKKYSNFWSFLVVFAKNQISNNYEGKLCQFLVLMKSYCQAKNHEKNNEPIYENGQMG